MGKICAPSTNACVNRCFVFIGIGGCREISHIIFKGIEDIRPSLVVVKGHAMHETCPRSVYRQNRFSTYSKVIFTTAMLPKLII